MPDTIRQQIISAIDTQLKTILVAGGYRTNLGQNVVEWDLTPMDPSQDVFRLTYRDEEETRADLSVGEQDMALPLTILALASGNTSLAEMRKMVADVVSAMYADPTWGGIASDTVQDGVTKLDKAQAADQASGAELKFRVEYAVERGTS